MQHKLDSYPDGFKRIPFCKVCGVEYPEGECSGRYKRVDNDTKNSDDKNTKYD